METKTALGINENMEGLLCYVLGFITGILFLVLEKDNKFVRFHAMQSIVTFLVLFVISMVFGIIPFLGWMLSGFDWSGSINSLVIIDVQGISGRNV
jgi:uncharacterized membrane protein